MHTEEDQTLTLPPAQISSPSAASASQRRMVVPDIARGVMLWGIAIANVATAWVVIGGGQMTTAGRVVNGSWWDALAIMFTTSFVHSRGFPMFATLLGFGLGIIAMSLYRRGYPLSAARGVLARRYGLLSVFGILHAVFLFWGDIMVTYGLLGLVLITLITVRTKILLWIAGSMFTLTCLMGVVGSLFMTSVLGSDWLSTSADAELLLGSSETYGRVMLTGLLMMLMNLLGFPVQAFMLLPLVIIGFVAAREGVLADPARYRKVLVWTATFGAVVAVGTGVPAGLEAIGVLDTGIFAVLTMTLGTAAGPGFIALLALLLNGAQQKVDTGQKLSAPLWALAALGRRSMTGYVLQSVIFLIVFAPFALGLFAHAGAGLLLLVGTGGWLLTLGFACLLEARGKKGPFEAVHRRLSYGKKGLVRQWVPQYPSASSSPL